jgi:hypothetical protein
LDSSLCNDGAGCASNGHTARGGASRRTAVRALIGGLAALVALLALSAPAFGAVRAAFYEPISAESWLQTSPPYSHHISVLGGYDSADAATVQQQVAWMEYANMDAGIAYWDGQGSPTDSRISGILGASASSPV